MKVAVAFDHRGVVLREAVLEAVAQAGDEVIDLGVEDASVRVDYPDQAADVAKEIRSGRAERGILVCGSGVGACVAACKVPGIRAAICHDAYSAHQGVEHDDINVLCLGSEIVGEALARELVRTFLDARFNESDPRYAERLKKVAQMERDAARELP
ncbi:MAG: RpiB/LacA/LacB family sugar-phosphate isomerase [Gaiellaceae bacterium]|jgi:ribose 5-phosphate isomerase B